MPCAPSQANSSDAVGDDDYQEKTDRVIPVLVAEPA